MATMVKKSRELMSRNDGGHSIRLLWFVGEYDQNIIQLQVVDPEGSHYLKDIDPKLAMHAFTHAGLYVPEAWEQHAQ